MPTPASPEVRRDRGAGIGAGRVAPEAHLPAPPGAPTGRAPVAVGAPGGGGGERGGGGGGVGGRAGGGGGGAGGGGGPGPGGGGGGGGGTVAGHQRRRTRRRAARPRHPSHLPAARHCGAAGRGECLDRAPAPPGLRRRRHGVAALRVSRAARHDVLHVGGARAREPHPLHRRRRRDRVGGRRAAAGARRPGRAPRLLGRAREVGLPPLVCPPVRVVRRCARPGRSGRRGGAAPGRHPAGGRGGGARLPGCAHRLQGRDSGRRVSRKLQLLLFLCGFGVFGYLVARIGPGTLVADAVRTGWMFVPILLLYGVVYVANGWAWWLIMADEPSRPPFWRACGITVASFSLNFLTPMVNVGGEPFKIAAVDRKSTR